MSHKSGNVRLHALFFSRPVNGGGSPERRILSTFALREKLFPRLSRDLLTKLARFCARSSGEGADEYLRAVYAEGGHVYAPFTPYRLHFHQKLTIRFTQLVTVIRW
jgi:hypothetical protein